jgi:hypothetical protein
MQSSVSEIIWATGLFDGEGYICLNKRARGRTLTPLVGINMCHKPTVEKMAEILGGKVRPKNVKNNPYSKKDQWIWATNKMSDIKDILTLLQTWSVTKRSEMDVMLEYIEFVTNRKSRIYSDEELKIAYEYAARLTRIQGIEFKIDE